MPLRGEHYGLCHKEGECRAEARRYASHFMVRVTRHFISLVGNR